MASGAAAIALAIQVSGTIVKMEPQQFQQLLNRSDAPLVVQTYGGAFGKKYQYLFSYKGLAFHTSSKERLILPGKAEVVDAKGIWVP
jgi:hypothetical protein